MASKFITVSVDIMRDTKLSPNQKFILAEIVQLSSLQDGCFATNKHFAELIGISRPGVSKAIKSLEDMGYIDIDNSNTQRNFGRIITLKSAEMPPINLSQPPINLSQPPINLSQPPINLSQQTKGNIHINIQKEEKAGGLFDFWVKQFKKPKNTNFTKDRKKLVLNRLNKYSVDEIKQAITHCSKSEFHVRNGHTDLTQICRNDTKLEYFRDLPAPSAGVMSDEYVEHNSRPGESWDMARKRLAQRVG